MSSLSLSVRLFVRPFLSLCCSSPLFFLSSPPPPPPSRRPVFFRFGARSCSQKRRHVFARCLLWPLHSAISYLRLALTRVDARGMQASRAEHCRAGPSCERAGSLHAAATTVTEFDALLDDRTSISNISNTSTTISSTTSTTSTTGTTSNRNNSKSNTRYLPSPSQPPLSNQHTNGPATTNDSAVA